MIYLPLLRKMIDEARRTKDYCHDTQMCLHAHFLKQFHIYIYIYFVTICESLIIHVKVIPSSACTPEVQCEGLESQIRNVGNKVQ